MAQVRRRAAEELYMQVLTHEGIVREEGVEEVMRVLPETDWTVPVAELKPIRDGLYGAFSVERVVGIICCDICASVFVSYVG